MNKKELIDKLEKELQDDQKEKEEMGKKFPLISFGFSAGWIQATRRIIELLREIQDE